MSTANAPLHVDIVTQGDVAARDVEKLRREPGRIEHLVKGPVLGVRAVLVQAT